MRESQWLKEYERVQKEKRQGSNQKKKVIFIILPIMLLLFTVPALMNGGMSDPQVRNGMLGMVVVFVGIFLFVVLMLSIGKKKDVTKSTRNSVKEVLKTDEDVALFDAQMNAAPLKVINIAVGSDAILTKDFFARMYNDCGDLKYRFARNEDIVSLHYKKTGSTTANPLKAAYFFDLRDAKNNVIMNGLADSGSQLAELENLLKVANPELIVKKEGGLL